MWMMYVEGCYEAALYIIHDRGECTVQAKNAR